MPGCVEDSSSVPAAELFSAFFAVLLLIAWNGDHIRGYDLFCLSSVLQEMAQLSLLFGVIIPPCVEDPEKKAP